MQTTKSNTSDLKLSERIKVGDTAQMQRTVCDADVLRFAELSGDYNPVHLDEAYAKTTRFGGRIAHGLFCSAMVSALLGMELPGLGTIILSENMRFRYPAYINDTVIAQVQVASIDPKKNRATISFVCKNQSGKILMDGSAEVTV